MAVLWTSSQWYKTILLHPFDFRILGIDPTYNLEDFRITVTVYKHSLFTIPLVKVYCCLGLCWFIIARNYVITTTFSLHYWLKLTDYLEEGCRHRWRGKSSWCSSTQVAHIHCFRHLQQKIETHLHDKHKWSVSWRTCEVFWYHFIWCHFRIAEIKMACSRRKLHLVITSPDSWMVCKMEKRQCWSWHTVLSVRGCRPGVTTKAFLHG